MTKFKDLNSLETSVVRKALKTVITLAKVEPKFIPENIPHPTILDRQIAENLLSAMNEKTDFLQMLDEL
jgi:hypothetical protein